MYRSGAPAEMRFLPPLPPLPPSRSKAFPFFVLGEVTPSWSSFTRYCFLSRSLSGLLYPAAIAAGTAEEQGEDRESRSPIDVPVVAGRATAEFPKVE